MARRGGHTAQFFEFFSVSSTPQRANAQVVKPFTLPLITLALSHSTSTVLGLHDMAPKTGGKGASAGGRAGFLNAAKSAAITETIKKEER